MTPSRPPSKKSKTPWPTKAAMRQVYEKHLWGGNEVPFYSGDGSHHPEIVSPYIQVVKEFLKSFVPLLKVCDLGCGDFNVGKHIVDDTRHYIAVDIVPELIEYNKSLFKSDHLEFHCKDIAVDNWPAADLVILRQVLQHLSNAEIQQITEKLSGYKYMILTEHLPHGEFIPNEDIISGQGIRLKKRSGVVLTAPPFNLKVKNERQLLSVQLENGAGVIVTTLFEM